MANLPARICHNASQEARLAMMACVTVELESIQSAKCKVVAQWPQAAESTVPIPLIVLQHNMLQDRRPVPAQSALRRSDSLDRHQRRPIPVLDPGDYAPYSDKDIEQNFDRSLQIRLPQSTGRACMRPFPGNGLATVKPRSAI